MVLPVPGMVACSQLLLACCGSPRSLSTACIATHKVKFRTVGYPWCRVPCEALSRKPAAWSLQACGTDACRAKWSPRRRHSFRGRIRSPRSEACDSRFRSHLASWPRGSLVAVQHERGRTPAVRATERRSARDPPCRVRPVAECAPTPRPASRPFATDTPPLRADLILRSRREWTRTHGL